MPEIKQSIGPKYSIGIVGIMRPDPSGFGAPERSFDIHGAEYVENDHVAEIRVATDGRAQGRMNSIAEKDSKEQVRIKLEEFATLLLVLESESTAVLDRIIEIEMAEYSRATIVIMPKGSGSTFISLHAVLGKGAELTLAQGFQEGNEVRYEEAMDLKGENAGVHIVTLLAPSGSTKLDISTVVRHDADHTRGHVRALGFLRGQSKTIYRATGDIAHGMISPDSSEEGRFIVVGGGAEISAIPSLDIASDHVATSHKLAIYRLGEKELFYPALRGLSETEARGMLEEGLIEAELSCIKNDEMATELKETISSKQR